MENPILNFLLSQKHVVRFEDKDKWQWLVKIRGEEFWLSPHSIERCSQRFPKFEMYPHIDPETSEGIVSVMYDIILKGHKVVANTLVSRDTWAFKHEDVPFFLLVGNNRRGKKGKAIITCYTGKMVRHYYPLNW